MNDRYMPAQISHDGGADYDRIIADISTLSTDEGIRRIKLFLMTYPSFALAHNDLGVLYHRSGNPTLALAHHEKASRLQPDNTTFRKNLADFYAVELGWLEDATDIYLELLRRNPRDTEALIALGNIGTAMEARSALPAPEQTAPALQSAVPTPAAVQLTPPPAVPPADLRSSADRYRDALNLANQGNGEQAIRALNDLLLNDSDFAPAHNDLGVLYQQNGSLELARHHQQRAVELQPQNAVYRKNLADLLFVALGDHQAALTNYNQLLAKDPRDVEVLNAIAQLCIDLGLLDDASHFLERVLHVQPWDRDARETLQKLKALQQQPPAEAPAAQQPDQLYREALELVKQERLGEARRLLETLVGLQPANAVAYNDLGVISYRLGDIAAAERSYQKACELEPACANFHKNLADLYFTESGRIDDAINIYLDLHKKYPRDAEVLVSLGQICTAVGHGEQGSSFFRRALEIEPWNRDARTALQTAASGTGKVFF